jgi:hypothetical protein
VAERGVEDDERPGAARAALSAEIDLVSTGSKMPSFPEPTATSIYVIEKFLSAQFATAWVRLLGRSELWLPPRLTFKCASLKYVLGAMKAR